MEKIVSIDQIEIVASGHVQVRQATRIIEDGKEIAKTYHRHVLAPGDDLSKEDARVRAIATAAWTPEVVAAYNKMVETRSN